MRIGFSQFKPQTNIMTNLIAEILKLAEQGQVLDVQPNILLNHNIDPTKIAECTSCYVNDSWAPKLKQLIDDGFIIFRVQTELDFNGHMTMAYLAKMKEVEKEENPSTPPRHEGEYLGCEGRNEPPGH
jgi:transcription initiation factor IIE alpha subunit